MALSHVQSDFVYENINIQGRALFSMGFFFSGGGKGLEAAGEGGDTSVLHRMTVG